MALGCADPEAQFAEALEAAGDGEHERAAHLFERAARGGLPRAQLALGWLYFHGRGVPGDAERTAYWWREAAEGGLVEAQARLAGLYRDGSGVERDPREAARWWRAAAEGGETMARFELGRALRDGNGVAADAEEAYVWLALAAEQGHQVAARARDRLEASLDAAALTRARERAERRLALESAPAGTAESRDGSPEPS